MKAAQVNDPAVQNLVRLLVDRARIQYLPAIARSFRTMADARQGRVRAQVSAATPLSADALSRVEQALGRLTRSRVVLESRVDPTLLGGVAAQIGSVVYDGTLRTQLEELHRNLTGRY